MIAVRVIGADRRGQFRSYQIKPKIGFLTCFVIWTWRFTLSTIKLTRLYFSFLGKMSEECFSSVFERITVNHQIGCGTESYCEGYGFVDNECNCCREGLK